MASLASVKEAVVITPSEPTPSCVLSLSAVDSQLFLRFTIEYLLVYPPPQNTNQALTATRVKAALAKALVPYYPLAGRVKPKPDGSGLEVVCRAQGAVFIEAVSDCAASEFQHAPRYVTQWRKLLSLHVADVLKGAPPVVVQLTWLKDGAAALGVGFNHCVCDGIGSVEFLNHFGELAAGKHGLGEFRPNPVWDRHLMDSKRITSRQQNCPPLFDKVPDLCGFMNRFNNERLRPTSVVFNRTNVTELKNLALSTTRLSSDSGFTSFEVLAGHVWRSWARSLNLSSNQILKLLFSVNVRQRVKPSLPASYYGNAFVLGCAQSSVKELTEKRLGHAAGLVKRAKERVGEEYVRGVVETVSDEKKAIPDSVGVLIVSQWSRLGLDRVDFGMGRPVHVGPICSDRYCLFLPVSDDGGGQGESVKVMVAVPTSAVDKYELLVNSPFS
ncbi:alcohol acyltransferase 9 [Argentina anserina]|uniref:alcohol acyltransferase 9 n=1 Tax=Argentina anserina TaxID=57926 RepID=UPI002176522E|nr:alcohol acyltransferase 9 [Potentilla anserina]